MKKLLAAVLLCWFVSIPVMAQDFDKLGIDELSKIANEQHNPKAQTALGDRYYSGDLVQKDYAKAREWYEKRLFRVMLRHNSI